VIRVETTLARLSICNYKPLMMRVAPLSSLLDLLPSATLTLYAMTCGRSWKCQEVKSDAFYVAAVCRLALVLSKGGIKYSIHPPPRNASGYWSLGSACGGGMWTL
jgi:hypothetical protein